MDSDKRQLIKAGMAAAALYSLPCIVMGQQGKRVQDILTREVMCPIEAKRIYLADSGLVYLYASLCKGELSERLIGLPKNFRSADFNSYCQYMAAFPALKTLPTFSALASGQLNIEALISLRPDVIFVTTGTFAAIRVNGALVHLTRAAIPVVVLDMSLDPMNNTPRSIVIMATVLNELAQAEAINGFIASQLTRVSTVLAKNKPVAPAVLFERAAGFTEECCLSYGKGNFAQLLTLAGGKNLGEHYISGTYGVLNQETVIFSEPEQVIVTGTNWVAYNPQGKWVNLGPGVDLLVAKQQLLELMQRPAYKTLTAVKARQVHAIWHTFYDSPFGFVALLKMATWLHPSLFPTLDAEHVFAEYYDRFLTLPWQSGYWVSLNTPLSNQ